MQKLKYRSETSYVFGLILERLMYLCIFITVFIDTLFDSYFPTSYTGSILPIVSIITLIYIIIFFFCSFFPLRINGYSVSRMLVCLVSLIFFWISYHTCENMTLLKIFLIAISTQALNYQRLVKTFFYGNLFGILFVVTLDKVGLIRENTFYRDDAIRHSLGFLNPNTLAFHILVLAIAFFVLRKQIHNIVDIIVLLALLIFTYRVTNSNTTSLVLALLLAFSFIPYASKELEEKESFFYKIFKGFLVILAIIAVGFTIYTIRNFNSNSIVFKLGTTFYQRFTLSITALQRYSIRPFGNKIQFYTNSYLEMHPFSLHEHFTIDNGYVFTLLLYGLVPSVILLIITVLSIKNASRVRFYEVLIMISLIFIYSIAETGFMNNTCGIFAFCFAFCDPIRNSRFIHKDRVKVRIALPET